MEPNTYGASGGMSGGTTSPGQQSGQQSGGGVTQELATDAKTIGEAARSKVEEKAAAGKDQATETARNTSSALNKAADAIRQSGDSPDWLTQAFEKTAREIDKLAGEFEGKDMRAIAGDVTNFARSNPMAFLAASAAVGFVAARFLRAGSEYSTHHSSNNDSDYTGTTGFAAGRASAHDDGPGQARSSFGFDENRGGQSGGFEGGVR